jgi:DNA-binding XRE family transcriptional regulator
MSQALATADDDVDQRISAAVLALIAQRKLTVSKTAKLVGVSRTTMYHRVNNERPWEAVEVHRLAQLFQVSRDSLYEGRTEFQSQAGASLNAVGTRSSTDRASDYGSEIGRSWHSRRRPDRRRRSGVVPLHLAVDNTRTARAIA